MAQCFLCGGVLIWGADFTHEEWHGQCDNCEEKEPCYGLVSTHTCSNCGADATFSRRCDNYKEV